ncbi:MAG: pilus assembly protein [Pseudomonadota bacterium]
MRTLRARLGTFAEDTRGSMTVEMVVTLPMLIWALVATYEFFEIHRYQSVRDKATYTIADMLSREEIGINDTYIDNSKILFDQITNDSGANQIRVSVVEYIEDDDQYITQWSEVRGTGAFSPFAEDDEFPSGHETLPIMNDGEVVILVESRSMYEPLLDLVFQDEIQMGTRVFTSLRFSPELKCEAC